MNAQKSLFIVMPAKVIMKAIIMSSTIEMVHVKIPQPRNFAEATFLLTPLIDRAMVLKYVYITMDKEE